jgi:hypothetical protein
MPEVAKNAKNAEIAKDGNGSEAEPILIKFHRHRYADCA